MCVYEGYNKARDCRQRTLVKYEVHRYINTNEWINAARWLIKDPSKQIKNEIWRTEILHNLSITIRFKDTTKVLNYLKPFNLIKKMFFYDLVLLCWTFFRTKYFRSTAIFRTKLVEKKSKIYLTGIFLGRVFSL